MRVRVARISVLALAALSIAITNASAERRGAPITFAGQSGVEQGGTTQVASLEGTLAGGADTSYGYGRQATPPRQGAVIDIRRPTSNTPAPPQRVERVAAPATQHQAPQQQAPNWLERERVGPPYEAAGRWYVPTPEPGYSVTGTASWYGPTFHGQATATGETFDQDAITAAHPTLPIPSLVQVTNLANGRELIVRVNDRGPFVGDRVIDLSHRAAEVLGFDRSGTAQVHVRYLGPAPRHYSANGQEPVRAPLAVAAVQPPAQAPQTAEEGPRSLLPEGATETPAPAPEQRPFYTPPVNRTAAAAPVSGGFVVQVGAFSNLATAQQVQAAVASAGPVSVDVRETASGQLHRVRLGPYASREEADAARRSLAGLGYGDAILAAR